MSPKKKSIPFVTAGSDCKYSLSISVSEPSVKIFSQYKLGARASQCVWGPGHAQCSAPQMDYHQSKWQDCMDADRRPIRRCTIGGHRHWRIIILNGRIAWMLIEGPSVGVP
jgi:hypothetical protein